MATPSHVGAVKSLSESPGGRRFVFRTVAQRIDEIKIDVYRSLDTEKAEPSEGSSFFRDCLIEYRELNTAEGFISLYEEIYPSVQTLPQIILQKDIIISSLLSRLNMEERLSLEPIFRLIAALSRDLLGDFIPFLPRLATSVERLLDSGAWRDPEIIVQIFTSWSCIIMHLHKYLVKVVDHVLSITAKLRYYPKNHIRELMAMAVSFLLRKTPTQQLKEGLTKLMTEVATEPSEMKESGAGALVFHVLRSTSSRLHSKAETLISLLLDNSSFLVGDQSQEGSTAILEICFLVFRRLYVELDPTDLPLLWKCLCGKITVSVGRGDSEHIIRLLTLLISFLQDNFPVKFSDTESILDLVDLLVKTYSMDCTDTHSEVIDKVLKLMLCVIGGLSKDMNILQRVSSKWEFVFYSMSPSLLAFVEGLLTKDPSIFPLLGRQITIAFDNLIKVSNEEVLYLMMSFCEKLQGQDCSLLDSDKLSRLHSFFEETLQNWIKSIREIIEGTLFPIPFQENELAVLWGVVRCFPHFSEAHASPSILIDLINAVEELLLVDLSGFPKNPWHSLIGAALQSYHKLMSSRKLSHGDSSITKFLDLAERYKLSPQIVSAVADILDEVSVSTNGKSYLPEYTAERALIALEIFEENLFHASKKIRLSALRILCHYEPLFHKEVDKDNMVMDVSEAIHVGQPHINVFRLLRDIENTDLSIATSSSLNRMISNVQTGLSAQAIADRYLPAILCGLVGIFHNRFSYLWNAVLECLAVLISLHDKIVWVKFFKCLEHCQAVFLSPHDQPGGDKINHKKGTGLMCRFISDHSPQFDSTPSATVLCSLIKCLQKLPLITESHTRQLIPLFLKFLGYNEDTIKSDAVSHLQSHKGEAWKAVLKEWLSLFRLLRNPKAFYQGHVFRNILIYRLLDQNDADIQIKVLDCLLNWRDDFLVPYSENMKNLINAEFVKDELTKWSISKYSIHSIDTLHRNHVIPIVIRLLMPKVRNLKMLTCQKSSRVSHRRAVLRFLAQLEVDELSLFFWLLIKPLLYTSEGDDTIHDFWSAHKIQCDEVSTSEILKVFTIDRIRTVSLKSKSGFLHVIEEIVAVFDESRLIPFLDLLMNCVVRILASCTSAVSMGKDESYAAQNHSGSDEDGPYQDEAQGQIMGSKSANQFKNLRSLCLKITYLVLIKHGNHELGSAVWDLFFSSVEPLIANFKQEAGASKNPSSLFCCFLAMSKSYKLVPLLDREGNLIADIFSILTVPSASESIISGVLKFIKNLLKLDSELGCQDASLKRILLPNLGVLLSSLHTLFSSENAANRQFKVPGKKEFTIFKFLSKYIIEPSAAEQFLDILLPHLQQRHQDPDTCVNLLQIIRQVVTVLGDASSRRILCAVTPLLISAGLAIRVSICQVLDAVAASDSSVVIVAKILRELNATSEMEIGGLDFDKILGAYSMVNVTFFYTISEEHTLPILAQCIHDMSSEELILRQSAFRLLVSFIDFLSEILQQSTLNTVWSEVNVRRVVNNIFMKYMGNAMEKEDAIIKVWLDLLKEMVLKIPTVANLGSYKALCCDDPEQDFFNNIVHLQKHRRAKAVSRFRNMVGSGNLSEDITNKVLVPLLFSMLFSARDGKDEHIRSACIDALASISGRMKWTRYYALLLRCFRYLTLKLDKQRPLLRLVYSILDHFHFSESSLIHGVDLAESDALDLNRLAISSSFSLRRCTGSSELPTIQTAVHKNLLPKIQKLLNSDPDNVNVNISLVALKLLKLLPGEIMDSQLPTIIHRISNLLRHRLDSVRDRARSALTACLKELGLEYLQYILKIMKASLKRGFELHVLGYTLNFMLSELLVNPVCGRLDYCVGDLLSVVEKDILDEVSEEKEVEKIASKMKETKKQKSYETLKLIAQSITFKSNALKLLYPVTAHLHKELTQKVKLKLEKMLDHIGEGIQCNPSVNQTELFIFIHCLIKDSISDEGQAHENSHVSRASRLDQDDDCIPRIHSNRLMNLDRRFSHLITAFALGLFRNYLNKLKLSKKDEQLMSSLDPFVSLLVQCLSSKYENIIRAGLKCLSLVLWLPLPSLQSQFDKIKITLLGMAQGSVDPQSELMESCMRLLTKLIGSSKVTLSVDQLHMLIQFPLFVDLAESPSFIALELLKAIVERKLMAPEIYDIVKIVAELMVQSQSEPIREKSRQIFLQFLRGYPISKKPLLQHLDFVLANLRYEHSTGREAVLEMLHAIIQKFPVDILDDQSQMIFVHLVASLANDADRNVRMMTAAAIKFLVEHVTPRSCDSILEYTLSWYGCTRLDLWAPSAQVLGLLAEAEAEDMEKSFSKHLTVVLGVMRGILESAASSLSSSDQTISDDAIPFWKEAYYSLVMLEKIVHRFRNLILDKDHEDIWETICGFLLHRHLWLRNISSRMLSHYFTAVTNTNLSMENFVLMKPSTLFFSAVSFCCQLKEPVMDDKSGNIILENLVFSIRRLNSILQKNESMEVSKFWSSLDSAEQARFHKAFDELDVIKGRRMLLSFTSDASGQHIQHQHPFISYLLQRMGKLALDMEADKMKIIFRCFKSISPQLLSPHSATDDLQHDYAYQMLSPLYRVCEGFAGKVISDDLKQEAQDVSESIRDVIGVERYIEIYNQIRKTLKVKRDKRKREEKVMAVVNPTRHAKRKLRAAAKHQAHKKRKMMTMRMGKWLH